jgi:hypothetical protein
VPVLLDFFLVMPTTKREELDFVNNKNWSGRLGLEQSVGFILDSLSQVTNSYHEAT